MKTGYTILPPQTFNALAAVLTPHMGSDSERRAFVTAALYGAPVLNKIEWGGTADDFTVLMVQAVDRYAGTEGLLALVNRLAQVLGPDDAAGLHDLRVEIREPQVLAFLREFTFSPEYQEWAQHYTALGGTLQQEDSNSTTPIFGNFDMPHSIYDDIGYQEARPSGTHTTETIDELHIAVREGNIVIIGEPGSGKTTTLKRLAYEFAVEAIDDIYEGRATRPLPIYVPLGAYDGGGLTAYIDSHFGGLFIDDYGHTNIVVLLDALNEMPRQYVSDVDRWIRTHPHVRVVVTCRRLDYASIKDLPLRRADVKPLDVRSIYQFISLHLRSEAATETLFWSLAGEDMTNLWQVFKAKRLAFNDFWFGSRIDHRHPVLDMTSKDLDNTYNAMRDALELEEVLPGLLGLVSNPFLLRIIIQVFMQNAAPPRNRGQLFSAFVRMLYEHRGKSAASDDNPWIDPEQQTAALATLAHEMQTANQGTSVPLSWATRTIETTIPEIDVTNLLYLAEGATLLVVNPGANEVRFSHQLLQEYFAARKMLDNIAAGIPAAHYWPDNWWESTGWDETAVQAAGLDEQVVRWLSQTHPLLACRALTEGWSPPDEDDRVREALMQAMHSHLPPAVRAEAGRLINRLGDKRAGVNTIIVNQTTLPDITWVSIEAEPFQFGAYAPVIIDLAAFQIARYPITNAQFRAFMDANDGYRNKTWWNDLDVAPSAMAATGGDAAFRLPNHPRVFVTWYEATAFCRWLTHHAIATGKLPADMYIRLPHEYEWERAASGTDGRRYACGNAYRPDDMNSEDTGLNRT
ncbi:MAG: SUMF1/EgtB/PvdO family nonheme iron enzyme, partial [Chloroflexota bacterium]